MELNTIYVHDSSHSCDKISSVSVPIFRTATSVHLDVGQNIRYDYLQVQNPTREYLEGTMARLEQGKETLMSSFGMAVISAVVELFPPGDHIICSDDLYGSSHRLFHHINARNGLSPMSMNASYPKQVEATIRPETKALFVETPTNPMMQVTNLKKTAGLMHIRGLWLIVDNTFLTPYLQCPLTLEADIVVHSGTKYLGEHNDVLTDFTIANDPQIYERLRFVYKNIGAYLSPLDSWLLIHGIKTLPLYMGRQEQSAGKIVVWLTRQSKVRQMFYTGLTDHPHYALSKQQASGFGSMISFEVNSRETAERILNRVSLIHFAEDLGGMETLITYPMLQTHAEIPAEERETEGIMGKLLHLSVGTGDTADLIANLGYALGQG